MCPRASLFTEVICIMSLNRRQVLRLGLGAAAGAVGLGAAGRPGQGGGGPDGYPFGIDVSNWQGYINWDAVANAGVSFAFCKATEGTSFADPWFNFNYSEMYRVGLYRGAYHFGHPAYSAYDQAGFFIDTVQPASGDLQMVLDIEVSDGRSPAQVWQWIQDFIYCITAWSGGPGIIYSGYYFWRDQVGNPLNNLNCPLWIPSWGSSSPLVPPAWSTWSFWQYSSTGHVAGVNGNCDLNYFNGGLDRLARLTLP
jgi:GH25 family lysozyme M1 (1,4-beta-N-acetylmuramidase)